MDGGLPYEYNGDDDGKHDTDHPMLDRALDDYSFYSFPSTPLTPSFTAPPTTSRDRGVIPEHVANLMNRMSRNKVYLAEESSGIIHHDAQERIRGDPRLARLAEELDHQDPTPWLDAISENLPSRIRPNALFVSSELIKHLSTAKVFTWASGVGATAMGIEWLNDSTLVLLFATPAATLLGLSMLAKAGFDPTEGDDPLLERAAHGIPASLLPQVDPKEEEKKQKKEKKDGDEDEDMETEEAETPAPAADDGIRRRGRGTFSEGPISSREPAGSAHGAFDLEPLAVPTIVHPEGVDPNARVTVRYATEADHAQRRGARDSEWYARHGRGAGKEVARRAYSSATGMYGREILDLKDRVGTSGEGRDFSRRIGRERANPYSRAPGSARRTANDLDAELDRMAAARATGEDEFEYNGTFEEQRSGNWPGRRRGGRGGRRERNNREDLDRELDEMFAARSSAS